MSVHAPPPLKPAPPPAPVSQPCIPSDGTRSSVSKPRHRLGQFPILAGGAVPLQAKLLLGPVDDPLERQADAVADAVVATRGLDDWFGPKAALATPSRPWVQRTCTVPQDEEADELLQVQGRFTSERSPQRDFESHLRERRGRGHPLPSATRGLMESRIGFDFSQVRIHVGNTPNALAEQVQAEAFTVGSDIYFASGRYQFAVRPTLVDRGITRDIE